MDNCPQRRDELHSDSRDFSVLAISRTTYRLFLLNVTWHPFENVIGPKMSYKAIEGVEDLETDVEYLNFFSSSERDFDPGTTGLSHKPWGLLQLHFPTRRYCASRQDCIQIDVQ